MENLVNSNSNNQINKEQIKLLNSKAILVLGLLSIAGSWMHGIVGFTMGIIALVLADTSKKMYIEMPYLYTDRSYRDIKAGVIYALIGTFFSGLVLFFLLVKCISSLFSKF